LTHSIIHTGTIIIIIIILGNTSTYKHTENDKADARAKTHIQLKSKRAVLIKAIFHTFISERNECIAIQRIARNCTKFGVSECSV